MSAICSPSHDLISRLRNSPEQYQEIKAQFSQFDKDKSGAIDTKELRACLYSLNDDRTKAEVAKIMEEFGVQEGKERVMKYEGFKEFMIRQLGDSDTADEVRSFRSQPPFSLLCCALQLLHGFELVSRGLPAGQNTWSDQVLKEQEVAYLAKEAPKAGGNPDYLAWIKAALAR